ncbi:MAG: hypothetical protein RL244_594, partial [Pseudomonadota bacterium]
QVNLVIGFIFVICVMLFRRGIVGEYIALVQRLKIASVGKKT